jgi:HEPN domain-containing protein
MTTLHQQWLDRAIEDLTVAQLVLQEQHTAHACFLSQQCIEKSLKAYLLTTTNTYPRTHKLVDLLVLCKNHNPTFSQFMTNCIVVDQYYIPTRYPDGTPGGISTGLPSSTEAQEAIEFAQAILEFVRCIIDSSPVEEIEQSNERK